MFHDMNRWLIRENISSPMPSSLTMFWNFGSILGLCLITQILSGVVLSMQYSSTGNFDVVTSIGSDVNYGWWLRVMHANGASMFFAAVYLHVGRGVYYGGFKNAPLWLSGVLVILMLMAVAFLGYVLPGGQMSLWGATVITNLISAVPYVGPDIVQWIWGGFSVSGVTVSRFFALHFLLPFALIGMIGGHILLLHNKGSNNSMGINSKLDAIPFHPYFMVKDMVGWVLWTLILSFWMLWLPWLLSDSENFMIGNPLVTPVHIKPEWYFLFAYAVLRSIPNKLGGVIGLALSILVLLVMIFTKSPMLSASNSVLRKFVFWFWVSVFLVLMWAGGKPVEDPYILVSLITSILYFVFAGVYSLMFV